MQKDLMLELDFLKALSQCAKLLLFIENRLGLLPRDIIVLDAMIELGGQKVDSKNLRASIQEHLYSFNLEVIDWTKLQKLTDYLINQKTKGEFSQSTFHSVIKRMKNDSNPRIVQENMVVKNDARRRAYSVGNDWQEIMLKEEE